MTDAEQVAFISNVLSINDSFTDPYAGMWEHIWWRTDDEYAPVTFFLNCNDLFYWACADSEELTPENFPMLKQCVDDVAEALGVYDPHHRDRSKDNSLEGFRKLYSAWKNAGSYASDLFCARVRQMRPQRPCYEGYPDAIKPMFDACGPERDPKSEG